MESCAHAFCGSFPWLQQFRVRVNLIPSSEDGVLYFRADIVRVLRLDDFICMPVKPIGKLTAFSTRQLQQGLFDLFDAHGRKYTTSRRLCE